MMRIVVAALAAFAGGVGLAAPAASQVAPTPAEYAAYRGLHQAAANDDVLAIGHLLAAGADIEARDAAGRTPFHVAAYASSEGAIAALAEAGADVNALEGGAYDAVTIAAVANDRRMLDAALAAGNRPGNVTSRWDGTALIAAAHLGHAEVVARLIAAGAPLDHVNNLGWTAMIEAVVLGDGGPDHQATLRHLVEAGADASIADRQGRTPLDLARERGYDAMVAILEGR